MGVNYIRQNIDNTIFTTPSIAANPSNDRPSCRPLFSTPVSCSKLRSSSLCLYRLPSPATPTLSPRTLYLRSTTNPPKSAHLLSRTFTRAAPSSSCPATSFLLPQQHTSHGRFPRSGIYGRPPQALSWP